MKSISYWLKEGTPRSRSPIYAQGGDPEGADLLLAPLQVLQGENPQVVDPLLA